MSASMHVVLDNLNRLAWPSQKVLAKEKEVIDDIDDAISPIPYFDEVVDTELTYSDEIIRMVSEAKSCKGSNNIIEIGKPFDIMSLLSCNGERYDLQRNSGEVVQFDDKTFEGKYIILCCFYVPMFLNTTNRYGYKGCARSVQDFIDTCFELYSSRDNDDFEVVMVAKMNCLANFEPVFDHFFSGFPPRCLAVPFSDYKRRDYICNYTDLAGILFRCVIMDSERTVISAGFPYNFSAFGADAFPFDEGSFRRVNALDGPLWGSPVDLINFVGQNHNSSELLLDKIVGEEKVSIMELNEKHVGLYLCYTGTLAPALEEIYQQCIAKQLQFEIVVVYLPFMYPVDPHVYQLNVDTMLKEKKIRSWWRLPFNNSVSRKLWRICYSYPGDRMITIGPRGKFADLYGGDIMSVYGTDGYPFTREAVIQSELNKLRAVTLESLLVYDSRDFVHRGTDETDIVAVSELIGRNILVYHYVINHSPFFNEVRTWYKKIKENDPEFEMVFILSRGDENSVADRHERLSAMPWLVCPYNFSHSVLVERKVSTKAGQVSTLVQFDKKGRICSIKADELLEDHGPNAFPFAGNLRKEIISSLWLHEFMEDMC